MYIYIYIKSEYIAYSIWKEDNCWSINENKTMWKSSEGFPRVVVAIYLLCYCCAFHTFHSARSIGKLYFKFTNKWPRGIANGGGETEDPTCPPCGEETASSFMAAARGKVVPTTTD